MMGGMDGCDKPMTCDCRACEAAYLAKKAGPAGMPLILRVALDDELRAECERRGVHVYPHDAHPTSIAAAWQERDEWKRRAEHMAKRIDEIKAERDAAEESLRHWIPKMREHGPGIDPRPDNSVAFLDEDLLADDA